MSESINGENPSSAEPYDQQRTSRGDSKLSALWEQISRLGLADQMLRGGTHIIALVLVVVVVLVMGNIYLGLQEDNQVALQATAEAIAQPTLQAAVDPNGRGGIASASAVQAEGSAADSLVIPEMPAFVLPEGSASIGISRRALLDTTIPNRARVKIETYEVQPGDNLFGIADKFGLQPTTILWGNYAVLQDNPRNIQPGQMLNILPVDGTYHKWSVGENLRKVAEFYGVEAEAVIEWPGNELDPYEINVDNPGIADGTWLIVPGGSRELPDWGPPAISRSNPAVAAYYGDGYCGQIYEGAIGNGYFVWPTPATYLSGYDYDPAIHPGIDIAGAEGNATYSVDNGVVVFAGWSNFGYGYMIVVDHGNGWQSAYAHLSGVGVYCGQSVFQGQQIGNVGNTGNSSGAHLHFELRSEIYGKVNPWNFLIQP